MKNCRYENKNGTCGLKGSHKEILGWLVPVHRETMPALVKEEHNEAD